MSTSHSKPSWATRLLLLVFVALPGVWCAVIGGVALGAALGGPRPGHPNYDDSAWPLSLFLIPSAFLLLAGTRTLRRPLFLLVFLPMPVLMSAGYHARESHRSASTVLSLVGVAIPVIAYPLLRLYYRRRDPQHEHPTA